MARSWTVEQILQRLKNERGSDAVSTLTRFRQRLSRSVDARASIEWRGSSKRIDRHATLWPWVVYKDVFYYPPACFRVDGEVEVPIGYAKRLAGRWNRRSFMRANREQTPFNGEEKRRKLLYRMNEIPGVALPDSVDGRHTFRLIVLKDEEAIDRLIAVFNWYIDEIASWPSTPTPRKEYSLEELRKHALEAAAQGAGRGSGESQRRYYERSSAVSEYVLARAAGTCEACGNPAPFVRPGGVPYLEPHHTIRLSDGGPDHPQWVGAVCPNCHREIHHGVDGEEKNRRLQERLVILEKS